MLEPEFEIVAAAAGEREAVPEKLRDSSRR